MADAPGLEIVPIELRGAESPCRPGRRTSAGSASRAEAPSPSRSAGVLLVVGVRGRDERAPQPPGDLGARQSHRESVATWTTSGRNWPDVVHVATEFSIGPRGRQDRPAAGAPAHRVRHRRRLRRTLRDGLGIRPGWLPALVLRPGRRGACPSQFYRSYLEARAASATPRSRLWRVWTRGTRPPRHRDESWRAWFGLAPDDLLIPSVHGVARGKKPRPAARRLVGAGPAARRMRSSRAGRAGPLAPHPPPAPCRVHVIGLLEGPRALVRAYASPGSSRFPPLPRPWATC